MPRESFIVKKERLKNEVLDMYKMVVQISDMSLKSLNDNNISLSNEAVSFDNNIDKAQVKIESHCVKIIATDQPVASDLRFLISSIKIIERLERIADYFRHVARTLSELDYKFVELVLPDVNAVINKSKEMLELCMDAFSKGVIVELKSLRQADNIIDDISNNLSKKVVSLQHDHPENSDLFHLYYLSRALERIGDHIINISEYIYYIEKGEYVDIIM